MRDDSCKTQADVDREDKHFHREVMEYLAENGFDIVPADKRYLLADGDDLWICLGDSAYRLDGDDSSLHGDLGPVTRAVIVARLRAEAEALERNAPAMQGAVR